MKKKPSPLKRWLTQRNDEAIRLRKLGATVMFPVSAVVGLLSIWFFYIAVWLFTENLSKFWIGLYAVLIVAGQFVVYLGLVRQRIAASYHFPGGDDPDNSGGGRFASWIWVLVLPAPRLLGLALELQALATRLGQLDVTACTKAINMVMKKQGRVLIAEAVDKIGSVEPDMLVRWLSDIEGVVIVRREGLGVTVTPGFSEEYLKWFDLNHGDPTVVDDDFV